MYRCIFSLSFIDIMIGFMMSIVQTIGYFASSLGNDSNDNVDNDYYRDNDYNIYDFYYENDYYDKMYSDELEELCDDYNDY